MSEKRPSAPKPAVSSDISAFLEKAAALTPQKRGEGRARLAVILDATASREPTWDAAVSIQADMFTTASDLGGLSVQLIFYRGVGECRASGWVDEPAALGRKLEAVRCRAGRTQIERALSHVLKETAHDPVTAFVFVGDAFEEPLDHCVDTAGRLGIHGVKGFFFQDGRDPIAERAFKEMALVTNGAFHPFDLSSPDILRELLSAVAAYAAGGRPALENYAARAGGAARSIAAALPPPSEDDD